MPERPTGITVLAILAGLGGILLLIGGIIIGVMASAISDFIKTYATSLGMGVFDVSGIVETFLVAVAAIAFIFGILYIAVAYGFWTGAGWSRMLAIILLILDIIGGLISLPSGIITIIIAGLVLWYLMKPHVKAFFGQGPAPATPPPPPA